MDGTVKASLETISVFTIVGTLLGWLPLIAAAYSVAWYTYLFYQEYKKRK